jgi:Ca-activated chloride channel family protein
MPTSLDYPQPPIGLCVPSSTGQPIIFPLKHTEVDTQIAGNLARVAVIQHFENPLTTALEAIYTFPLPDEAAVDEMEIRIGDRLIRGNIKKRQEALQIYEQAKQQGRTAGLLEQERDNIFTQSLANIQPGEKIEVTICYTHSLKFERGSYEFVLPMVVGPRYIPGTPIEEAAQTRGTAPAPMTLNQDTDLVPDGSHLNAPVLPLAVRSGHDISVVVEIDAGVDIGTVVSPSHQIHIERQGRITQVKLTNHDTIPNKDLILRYQIAGENTQSTVLTQADDRGGHFAIFLIPALQYRPEQLVPKEVVFLIDTSGSQMGDPLCKCQELMRRFIQGLNPLDTFNIVDFSNTTRQLSPVPLPNTPSNQARAIRYVDQLNAGGGTELLRGIRAVLNLPQVDTGRLRSIVLLTDGYIGDENRVLAEVQRYLQPGDRLYSFGAGSSVNRFLLNRIAEMGRGMARIIHPKESTEEVADAFFRQINNPVLTNLQLRWEGTGALPVIYPSPLPDLFAEQPLVLIGRKPDRSAGRLHLTGDLAGRQRYSQTFAVEFAEAGNPAIAQLWGRARIKDFMNQMVSGDTKAGVEAVMDTALTYQLLSQYTAFVAVDSAVRVDPAAGFVSVQMPVEMPEGVSHIGVFGNSQPVPQMLAAAGAAPMAVRRRAPATVSVEPTLAAPSLADDFLQQESLRSPDLMPKPLQWRSPQSAENLTPPSSSNRLQVVSASGLDQSQLASLTQHLQSAQLPPNFQGTLVFEFQVNQGRVTFLVLDEQASTLKQKSTGLGAIWQLLPFSQAPHDPAVIDQLRQRLLTWKPPSSVVGTVRLTLRLQIE